MIEARAVVLRLDSDAATDVAIVAVDDHPTCSRCAAAGGCGAAKLTRALCIKPREYRVANPVGARPGDKVTIGVPEGALLKSSVAVYLVPLALLVGGAILGGLGAPAAGARDAYAIFGSLSGLMLSVLWIRFVSRRFEAATDIQPVILRREQEQTLA